MGNELWAVGERTGLGARSPTVGSTLGMGIASARGRAGPLGRSGLCW